MSDEARTERHLANRTSDYALIGMTISMFITNIILIAVLVGYSYRVTMNDERYATLRQDYLARIEELDRKNDARWGRATESINTLQFTTDKRIGLVNDRLDFQLNELRNNKASGH